MAGGGSKPGERRGGRKPGTPNKATADLRAIAQKYTVESIEHLINVIRSTDSDAARVAAIREMLDRGHGKATQIIGGDASQPLTVTITTGVPRGDTGD